MRRGEEIREEGRIREEGGERTQHQYMIRLPSLPMQQQRSFSSAALS